MSHIFISYSREDSDCVLKVARQLEAAGYPVWIDVESIPGGNQWANDIARGISEAPVTLVFWSDSAAQSDYVRQEYEKALQKQSQYPQQQRLVIPVLLESLDDAPLTDALSGIQAEKMFNCSRAEVNNLMRRLPADVKKRQVPVFDFSDALGQHPGAKPLTHMPELVRVPYAKSVHCSANIISHMDTSLSDVLTVPDPQMQVFLRFMFGVHDEGAVEQIHTIIQNQNAEREVRGDASKLFWMIEITGPVNGDTYSLRDSPDGFWQGEWLDAVRTTFDVVDKIAGKNTLIQLFNAVPATLNFAIGMQFFKYWHLHLYHYTRDRRYQFVMDTADL